MNSEQILSHRFAKAHPTDAAKRLETLPVRDIAVFFETLQPDLAARILQLMMPSKAVTVLEALEAKKAATLIAEIPIEMAAILLARLTPTKRTAVFDKLPDTIARSLGLLLHDPENTAGALMNPQTFCLFDDLRPKKP